LLNNRDSKYTENSLELDEQIKNSTENLSKEIIQVLSSQLKSSSQNKLLNTSNNNNNNNNNNNERNSNDLMKKTAKKMNKSTDNLNRLTNTTSTTTSTNSSSLSSKKKDSSRSVSLNDLLNMDIENDSIYLDSKFNNNKNNLNMIKCGSDAKSASTHTPTTTTTNKRTKMPNKEMNNLISKSTNSILSGKTNIKQSYLFPPPPPPTILNKQHHQTTTNNNNNKQQLQSILKNSENSISSPPSQLATTLSSTSMMLIQNPSNHNLNDLLAKRIDLYKCKQMPKERLEIDILPSYLSFAQNKLLIASTNGRIRVIDLFSYKIQKDELKNILINGICIPKYFNDFNSDMFYTVSNAEMKNQQNDPLCVSNSVVIVTKTTAICM